MYGAGHCHSRFLTLAPSFEVGLITSLPFIDEETEVWGSHLLKVLCLESGRAGSPWPELWDYCITWPHRSKTLTRPKVGWSALCAQASTSAWTGRPSFVFLHPLHLSSNFPPPGSSTSPLKCSLLVPPSLSSQPPPHWHWGSSSSLVTRRAVT